MEFEHAGYIHVDYTHNIDSNLLYCEILRVQNHQTLYFGLRSFKLVVEKTVLFMSYT